MKRILSITLALLLVMAAAFPAMAEVTEPGALPIVTEPLTLVAGIIPRDRVEDYETSYYTRFLEEKTGISLDFFFFPSDEEEATQKFELMVAAQETLPEVILTMWMSDAAKASYGAQGVFLPLNDYFDTLGYFWNQSFEANCDDTEKELISTQTKSPDGNIYGFPFYDIDPTDTQVETIYMNKVWLDKLGLEVPQTLDDLYDVLVHFRDDDPNGNGIADELPLVGYNNVDYRGDLIFILANSFLYYNYSEYGRFVVEDGKIDVSYNKEPFREALRYVKKLYDENLIAPISFTQDYKQLKAMIDLPDTEDTMVGAVAVHPWSGSQGFTYTKDGYSKLKEYIAIGPLTGPEGVAYSPYLVSGPKFTSYITKDCANPEAAFRLMDFMSEPTTSLVSRRGEQGVDWDYVTEDNTKPSLYADLGIDALYDVFIDEWTLPSQNQIWTFEVHFLPIKLYAGVTRPDYASELLEARDRLYLDGFFRRYGQYPDSIVTNLMYTADEMDDISEISTVISEYANQARVLFVTGDMDLDKDWDNYVQTLDSMGLQQWIETAQAAYDRMHE